MSLGAQNEGIIVSEPIYMDCQPGCLARVLFAEPVFSLVTGSKRCIVTVAADRQCAGLVLSMDGLAETLQFMSKPKP